MNKKIISAILTAALILSASSCGGAGTSAPSTAAPSEMVPAATAATGGEPSGTGAASTGEKKDGGTTAAAPAPSATEAKSGGAAESGSTAEGAPAAEAPSEPTNSVAVSTEAAAADSAASVAEPSGTDGSAAAPVTTVAPTAPAAEEPAAMREERVESYAEADDADYYAADGFMYDMAPEPSLAGLESEKSLGESAEFIAADSYDEYIWDDWFVPQRQTQAGLLTGGEWRDNSNYAFWCSLFGQREDWASTQAEWKIDTTDRVYVRVIGSDKRPAAGLTVKLASGNTLLWQSVTDSRGEAFLFPHIIGSSLTPDHFLVETTNGAWKKDLPKDYAETDTPYEITIDETAPMRTQLDLMFMIDTTGSMGDELSYIQTELENVIDRVYKDTNTDIQLSVNFYRDESDDYVVRDFGFTKNISIAIDHLRDQRASGGGDYEEAVEKALSNALNDHKWRAGSEKLMFLVLDAPPHYSKAVQMMPVIMELASEMGVRIIPVASSGVDTTTEFLCRSMALATGGTYTFLTDDSGIGESHLAPTIGSYEVEKLNDMLVRIITDYFTQGERTIPAVPDQSGQSGSLQQREGMYVANYDYTSDYFSGSGYYTKGVIKSKSELDAFVKKYGFDFNGLGKYVDFGEECIIYDVELLSSGSITVDKSRDVYCMYDGEKVTFDYKLIYPEVGTADIKTLYLYAAVPAV